jgi:lysophospholipase L1-like esterase
MPTILCVGDSITDGECVPAGQPYPARLADLSGLYVTNGGRCGERSGAGALRSAVLIERLSPECVCILYGSNDAIYGIPPVLVVRHVWMIVANAARSGSRALVATLPPMYDSHASAAAKARAISAAIRSYALRTQTPLVDIETAFGADRTLIQEDGLHPSDSGTQLIADEFFAVLQRLNAWPSQAVPASRP